MDVTKRSLDNKNWRLIVKEDIMCEGFHYALRYYDDYEWVNDDKFQKLLRQYNNVVSEIVSYIGIKE